MSVNTTPQEEQKHGYDATFVSEVADELRCVICHLVLREPVQIMACGHRFCAQCFQRMKHHSQQYNSTLVCPVDRDPVSLGEVFANRAASRTVGNLKVRCGNHQQGCEWVDDLRDLQTHEGTCNYRPLQQQMSQEASSCKAPPIITESGNLSRYSEDFSCDGVTIQDGLRLTVDLPVNPSKTVGVKSA